MEATLSESVGRALRINTCHLPQQVQHLDRQRSTRPCPIARQIAEALEAAHEAGIGSRLASYE